MAEASTESIVPLSTFEEQVRLDKSQEYVTSYNGEVCHLTNENGILKFSLRGSKCYVFFIFKNVYSARDNKAPIHPNQISIKQAYNFHILPVSFRSVNNVRCFHAGLVWKRSKPKDVLDISFDPDKAISVLKSFARTNVPAPVPVLQLPSPLPKVVKPREVKQILSGQTGIVWKALNDREGLMLIRKDKAGKIIWFNKSNLEKVQAKFVQLRQLVGVALHFDAELLHAPANPDDFLWYQGTAFWDSGQLRPSIPNGFVGVKILNYKPTHDFSVKLKQAVELKTTGQFPQDGIDKIFKELTMARMFKDVTSPSKKENKDNEVAQLWDSVKRLNEGLKSLKLETERRTSLPGSDVRDEDPRTKSCNSLPNAVRNERPPQTGTSCLNYNWRGNDVYYFNFPELKPVAVPETKPVAIPKIKPAAVNELFETPTGHFLNLKQADRVPNYFFPSLKYKTVFHRLLWLECKSGEINVTGLPSEINEQDFIERTVKDEDKRMTYLLSVPAVCFVNVLLEKEAEPLKFLLKEPGSINHLSEDSRTGLIHCKYGCVYFKWEDFYDYDSTAQKWNVGDEVFVSKWLRPIFFDGYHVRFDDGEPSGSCRYVATCVWTERRPDIQKLIESVADVPKKLKPGKYDGHVVKLDLPSNAIVKLIDENVGVVVTRGIFNPKRTGNICDYLSLGEKLQVSVEDHTVNYYAENAIRQLRLPPGCTETVEGYGVITNYSNRLGIFEYRLNHDLLTGIFSKDLARISPPGLPQPIYLPIGSYVRITGSLISSHKFLRVLATTVRKSPFLKENPSQNPEDKPEFVPKKTYLGVVESIRKPYACVLKAVNENNKKVNVFVSSRNFAPGKWKPCLTYADQIQFHLNVKDKVMFTAEVCSDILGLHPFKWNAVKAWKIETEESKLTNSTVAPKKRELSSTIFSDPKPLWIFQPIELNNTQQNRKESPSSAYSLLNLQSIKKEDPRSTFLFPAPVNNLKPVQRDESFEEAMLKTALKNSLRDEAVMPESLMNRIVDNFSKRLTKEMFQGNKKNKTDTKEKATQTLSTGKVIYLKVHPS